jgi:hypothetical protein
LEGEGGGRREEDQGQLHEHGQREAREGKTEGKAKPREGKGSRGSSRREEMEEVNLPIKEYTFSEKAVNFS